MLKKMGLCVMCLSLLFMTGCVYSNDNNDKLENKVVEVEEDYNIEDIIKLCSNNIGNKFLFFWSIIIQYILYNYFGVIAGNIGFFKDRVTYDSYFSGYSIASLFLGSGIAYSFACYNKRTI